MKPRLLDLFCGAGGASRGYYRAGFDVVGVDLNEPSRYPYRFIQGDALTFSLEGFDVIHASPPCQRYTRAQNAAKNAHAHPDLVPVVRERLIQSGCAWIIENVVGAPLINPVVVCGLALGLKVKRHRLFESNLPIVGTACPSHAQDYYVIFGHEVRNRRHGSAAGRKNNIEVGRAAMGIDWMSRAELSEAIPPPPIPNFSGDKLRNSCKMAKVNPPKNFGAKMPDCTIATPELAEIAGIDARTIRRFVQDGILPPVNEERRHNAKDAFRALIAHFSKKSQAITEAKISDSAARERAERIQAEVKTADVLGNILLKDQTRLIWADGMIQIRRGLEKAKLPEAIRKAVVDIILGVKLSDGKEDGQ